MSTATLPGQWIAGTWVDPGDDRESTNPAEPVDVVARFGIASADHVDAAVSAASTAARSWHRLGGVERGRILHRVADELSARTDELADLLVREEGKTRSEAVGELERGMDTLHYNAARALAPTGESFDSADRGRVVQTRRVPVGVVAVITPWNFPVAIPIWKLAPALAHGNTVVWKPSELVPAISVLLTEVIAGAGVPNGVVNTLVGDQSTGTHLVAHADVAAITFTGSVPTGQAILAAAGPRGARIQLELGGHNPALVFGDADLDRAATDIVAGAMGSTGQKCTATRRVLVASAVHDDLRDRILARAGALRIGPGSDPATDLGPVVSADSRDRILRAVEVAVDQGATALTPTGRPDQAGDGWFVRPTVLAGQPDLDICREEVFGPVTTLLPFDDDDEAFRLANATPYGLSAAVHTRSAARVRRALEEVDAGLVTVNGPTTGADLHVPFGGVKASSGPGGREMGEAAREFFTETRTAYLDRDLAP
ncbi:MAG TPA: aldehyde dehydrogenase family protein [Nitriliruptoraceae bacterium]|nr:aldehyde dehydrogenase family protein [Nitriliruptoraceae bacterium]